MSYYPYATQVMVSPPRRTSTAHLVIAWIVALLSLLYMLPWAVAASRNKSNTGAIALINLFLGWSVIGWVVALVMACSAESNQPQVIVLNGHGMPAYPVQGHAPDHGVPIYPQAHPQQQLAQPFPQQQLPAAYAQAAPTLSPYAQAPLPSPYTETPYAASPQTAPYPTSPATAPYPTSPDTAAYTDAWSRPADQAGAAEITRPLPALSDPYGESHGRQ